MNYTLSGMIRNFLIVHIVLFPTLSDSLYIHGECIFMRVRHFAVPHCAKNGKSLNEFVMEHDRKEQTKNKNNAHLVVQYNILLQLITELVVVVVILCWLI